MTAMSRHLGFASLAMDAGVFATNGWQLYESLSSDKASRGDRASNFANTTGSFLVLAGGLLTTTPAQLLRRIRLTPAMGVGLGLSMVVMGKSVMSLESSGDRMISTKAMQLFDGSTDALEKIRTKALEAFDAVKQRAAQTRIDPEFLLLLNE